MKHFLKLVLTVLLTTGILLSAASIPVMAGGYTDTRTEENPYVLTKDSYNVCIIEFLDENDQPLSKDSVYVSSTFQTNSNEISYADDRWHWMMMDNPGLNYYMGNEDRELLGITKFKLRFSIREDVEFYLKQGDTATAPNSDFFDDCTPIKPGEISELYTLDNGPLEFYSLFIINGNRYATSLYEIGAKFYERLTVDHLESGAFELGFAFGDINTEIQFPLEEKNTIATQDTKDDPIVYYATADQLDQIMIFDKNNCDVISVNGIRSRFCSKYPLSGLENYITIEYKVNGESEPCTSRVIICEEGKELWKNPFTDVKDTDTFYNALSYCHQNGLLNGTSATEFSPEAQTNRAMIVTTLYRIAGSPAVTGENHFTDVPADQWYTNAVIWASENGIVNGYDSEHFGPMDVITREQFATILYRYTKMLYPGTTLDDVSTLYYVMRSECNDFSDAADYAKDALSATADNFILGFGFDENYGYMIYPKDPVTRADLANGLYGLNRSLLVRAGLAN